MSRRKWHNNGLFLILSLVLCLSLAFARGLEYSEGVSCVCFAEPLVINEVHKAYLYGDYEEAVRKALVCKQSDITFYWTGLSCLKMGQYSCAQKYFLALLEKYPRSKLYEKAQLKLADTFFLKENFSQTKVLYEKMVKNRRFANYRPRIYLRLAQIASKEGRWEDKKGYLEEIKKEFPQAAEMRFVSLLESYGDYFTIQIGAFSDKNNALSLKREIEQRYPAYLIKDRSHDLTLYKVRVGKYKKRENAEKIASALLSQGYPARIYP